MVSLESADDGDGFGGGGDDDEGDDEEDMEAIMEMPAVKKADDGLKKAKDEAVKAKAEIPKAKDALKKATVRRVPRRRLVTAARPPSRHAIARASAHVTTHAIVRMPSSRCHTPRCHPLYRALMLSFYPCAALCQRV